MLDVHPPHEAAHTWKDFFIHVATICVGLLIAIALEQTVEFFHHHHELQKARVELHYETDINRLTAAKQLECIHQVQAELNADMALLLAHRATGQPLTGPLHFGWNFRRVSSSAWTINRESGALNLMPHPELVNYDYIFNTNSAVMDAAAKWQVDLEIARAIAQRSPTGSLSPQDTIELITAISNTEGNLVRTERLITFVKGALDDHSYDY
ncbi:MAG: hypothetical protein WBY53_04475 [Acidobacteriaceae bacterium]